MKCVLCGKEGGIKPDGFEEGYAICDPCALKAKEKLEEVSSNFMSLE